jgi:hypothetical protein
VFLRILRGQATRDGLKPALRDRQGSGRVPCVWSVLG